MVSSAVYRYVASRDELLTLLITDAYDSLGEYSERAEAKVARHDLPGRFVAVGQAFRRWALRHPHEYALIFGSPVPGYAAPETTVAPAARVPVLLITVLADHVAGAGAGRRRPGRSRPGCASSGLPSSGSVAANRPGDPAGPRAGTTRRCPRRSPTSCSCGV